MFSIQRPLLAQQFSTFGLTVAVTATPLSLNLGITSLVDSFFITVPAAAANSVFFGGDASVTTATGLELLAGTTTGFVINHDGRQMYELQLPLFDIQKSMCVTDPPEAIPFVVWDLTQIFLIAVAPTSISCAPFKAMYI